MLMMKREREVKDMGIDGVNGSVYDFLILKTFLL